MTRTVNNIVALFNHQLEVSKYNLGSTFFFTNVFDTEAHFAAEESKNGMPQNIKQLTAEKIVQDLAHNLFKRMLAVSHMEQLSKLEEFKDNKFN